MKLKDYKIKTHVLPELTPEEQQKVLKVMKSFNNDPDICKDINRVNMYLEQSKRNLWELLLD